MSSENDALIQETFHENHHKILETMEKRRRKRLMITLAGISLLCATMGAIFVWRLNESRQSRKADEPMDIAAAALKTLNRHASKKQSKHVKQLCESTLLIFRHCEKYGPITTDANDQSQHCSYLGYERALFISTLFGADARWPTPAHLFYLTPERGGVQKHSNFREWETLEPLSEKTGLVAEIQSRSTLPKQYFQLLQSGKMCGKVSVVSWKHEYIPELAQHLGCGPDNGCPNSYPEESFDQIWQLKYVFHPERPVFLDEDKILDDSNVTVQTVVDEIEMDNSDQDDNARSLRHRTLKHKKDSFSKDAWNVYATVSNQNFDPLAFSKQSGNYPEKGEVKGSSLDHEAGL